MATMETPFGRLGPTNPPGGHPGSFEAWQALVAPGDVFRHPREVLAHPHLSRGDKRAILASWASDACALENAPGLRCLTGSRAEPVSVDAVLSALADLDRDASPSPLPRNLPERRRLARLSRALRPRRRDDDDDPPPSPAAAMPRPPSPLGGAGLSLRVPA